MQEENKEINKLDIFFDEDPTEELPVLTDPELVEADASDADVGESTGEAPILTLDSAVPGTLPPRTAAAPLTPPAQFRPRPGGLSLQRLESELQALQMKFLDLESDLRLRDDEIEQLQIVLAAREDAIGVLEGDLGKARQVREALLDEQNDSLAGLEDLRQEIAARDRQLAEAGDTEKELNGRLEQARAEADALSEQLKAEQAARQAEAADRARRDEQVALDESARSELYAKIADLEAYIAGRADRWEALRNERDRQARSLAALEVAASRKAEQFERRSRELDELRVQLDEQRQLHADAQAELTQSLARVAELEIEVAGQREEIGRLQRTLSDVEGSADGLQERLLERARQIEELTQSESAAKAQADALGAKTSELSQSLESRLARIEEMAAENAALTANLAAREEQIAELDTALDEVRGQARSLEDQLTEATRSAESLASAREASETRANELAEQVRDRESQLAQASRQLQDALAADRELNALAQERAEALSLVQAELGEAVTRCDELSAQLAESEADRDQLRERNAEQARQLTERDNSIQALEKTLGEQREQIETLSREAAHMADLEARIRGLDDRLTGVSKVRETDTRSSNITRVMVTVNSDRAIKYPLYKRTMTIGRSADSDIRIRRQYISRHHARLHQDDGVTYSEDLGSKNGVRVNAAPVDRQPLNNGDLVDIGQMQFRYIDLMAANEEGNA